MNKISLAAEVNKTNCIYEYKNKGWIAGRVITNRPKGSAVTSLYY